ncbi:MAG: hypothetical protein AAFQ89_15470 [Cyanobacteria bacterium J06626_18]
MPTTGDRGNTIHPNAIALSPKAPWQYPMSPSSIPAEPSIPAAVETFCQQHGFSEPFLHESHWWAFPRGQVMPIPLTTSNNGPTQRQLLHLQAELVVTHVALEQAQHTIQQQAATIRHQSFINLGLIAIITIAFGLLLVL